nr:hypothetical protein [Tanacetum cinerariifolium]
LVFDPGGKWVCDLGGSRGSKEYEFGGVREMVPGNIRKHGMGGNEPILNDIFVDIADKLTDKQFKISTFMETQVGYLCIRLWLGLYGYQICLKTFSLEKVLEYSKRIREPVRYEVRKEYIEGWEDEDKYLNVFDYDYEVYYLSRKALLGAKEFFVNKKQEDFDKIKRDIKHETVKELVDGSNGLVE